MWTETVRIPFYTSTTSAGLFDSEEHTQPEYLEVNKRYVHNPETSFCVRVSGDSMIEAGIDSGSLLVVDRTVQPSNGKIVVAILNGELIVKRFFQNGKQIILAPENPNYPSIEVGPDDTFIISGVVMEIC